MSLKHNAKTLDNNKLVHKNNKNKIQACLSNNQNHLINNSTT